MAGSTNQRLTANETSISNLNARIIAITPNNLIFAALGAFVKYGCKVTEGSDDTDLILSLEGEAAGDSAFLNPDISANPTRQFEFPNIASLKGGDFASNDTTATVITAPTAGTSRYDIAYVFAGKEGAGFAIADGSASASVLSDFTANGLQTGAFGEEDPDFDPDLPVGAVAVARIYVAADVTAITDTEIADLRTFSSFQNALTESQIADAFASPPVLGSITPNVVNATTLSASGTITGPSGTWSATGIDLDSGDSYSIDSNVVLTQTTLGGTVLTSSLTSLGTIASLVATTVDINAGTVDAVIGGTLPQDGSFTTLSATGTVTGPSGTWDSGGMDLAASDSYAINSTDVLTATVLGAGVVTSSLTTVGALNAGSITSGFGNINIGSSTFDTSGAVNTGDLAVAGTVKINSPDAGAAGQHIVKLDSSNVATNIISGIINENTTDDNWAELNFQSVDSSASVFSGVRIGAQFTDHTNATVDADFVVKTAVNGIFSERFRTSGLGINITQDLAVGGAITSGEITSGFGNIDIGSSTFTNTGTINTGLHTITSNGPKLDLLESDADSDFSRTSFRMDGGVLKLQTRTSANVFVSDDYQVAKNSSGATSHEWRVANAQKFFLGNTNALFSVGVQLSNSAGPMLLNEAASANNVTVAPDKTDTDTGLGRGGTNKLNLIAGGVNQLEVSGASGSELTNAIGNMEVHGGNRVSLLLGADDTSNTAVTDATQKNARLGTRHYTNAEEAVALAVVVAASTVSTLSIGGGTSSMNAANRVRVFAAANNTTVSGTKITETDINGFTVSIGDLSVPNGFLSFGSPVELTITSGVVTATQSYHLVDTESDDAADDLVTINGGAEGKILILKLANSARVVTVKETGNIALDLAGDFVMNTTRDRLVLLRDDDIWVELSRSNNA